MLESRRLLNSAWELLEGLILGFDIFNSGTFLGGLIFLGNFLRIQKNLKLSFHNVIHETEDVWVFRVLLESRRLLNSAWELLEGLIFGTGIFFGFNFCPYLIITVN